MADTKDSIEFETLTARASKMIEGIDTYRKTKEHKKVLPPTLDAAKRRATLAKLKASRKAFTDAEKLVAKTSKAYREAFVATEKQLAQDDDAVRGYLGKGDDRVQDFGTKRIVPSPGRRKSVAPGGPELPKKP